ncbi:hypothetical protein Y032_0044g1035 [Ancylostoma ceylanicum]|nr:hypothetical protein Y032_0044g1035 [Ancylostoma ceylanicum]
MITRRMTKQLQEGEEATPNKPKSKPVFRMRLRSSNKAWLRKREAARRTRASSTAKKERSKHPVPVERKKRGPLTLTEMLERNAAKQKAKDATYPLTGSMNIKPESPWNVLKQLWHEHLGKLNDPSKEFNLNL